MQAIGWDLSYYADGHPKSQPTRCDQELLCTLAGRAYSGYVCTAAALAMMAAIGTMGWEARADDADDLEDSGDGESAEGGQS